MLALSLLLVTPPATSTWAANPEWPQYRGPNRDSISKETGALSTLGKDAPKQLWKAAVGTGYSSVAIADGLAYVSGNAKDTDTLFCFDAQTGKEVWRYSYPCKLIDSVSSGAIGGPASTPTVSGGAVYALSRDGDVFRFEARTGKVVWGKNLAQEIGAKTTYGYASSPVIVGNLVIYNMNVAGVALNKDTGEVVWKSDGKPAGHATPVLVGSGAAQRLVIAGSKALVSVDPASGKQDWTYPYKMRSDPLVIGDSLFVSSGPAQDSGCALLKLAGSETPTVAWQVKGVMRTYYSTCVQVNGFLYGPDHAKGFQCIDAKTGELKWSTDGLGMAGALYADGRLMTLSEKGELVIIEASPDEYKEVSRTQVLSGKSFTMPTLCAGKIYCRNVAGEVVCLSTTPGPAPATIAATTAQAPKAQAAMPPAATAATPGTPLPPESLADTLAKMGAIVKTEGNAPGGAVTSIIFTYTHTAQVTAGGNKVPPYPLTDDLVQQIAKLPKVTTLECNMSPGLTAKAIKAIGTMTQLEHLSLNGMPINDASLADLAGLTKLNYLRLSGATGITAKGWTTLENFKQLQTLWVAETKLDDEGIQHFKPLTQLKDITLYGTSVTDAGAEVLLGLPNLVSVRCAPRMTPAGMDKLRTALPGCKFSR